MSPAARIAARLRERLPEASFRVVEGADCCEVFDRHQGRLVGWTLERRREWAVLSLTGPLVAGSVEPGPGWPERLGSALADALTGAGR